MIAVFPQGALITLVYLEPLVVFRGKYLLVAESGQT